MLIMSLYHYQFAISECHLFFPLLVSIYGHVIDLIEEAKSANLKQVDDLISKEKSAFEIILCSFSIQYIRQQGIAELGSTFDKGLEGDCIIPTLM
jgi:hypothetical protein